MLNFPIGGGTSGHFLGAVTAAALLGPWSACIVLALVLVIQGLLFADGGMSALGTNILNMGIIGGIVGYAIMRGVRALLPAGRAAYLVSAAAASWTSVVLASSVCALELAMSGTSPLAVAFPAMAGTHAIIGIGEALIATAVLTAAARARPDIIPEWANLQAAGTQPKRAPRSGWVMAAAGLALAVALALFGSPFASESPDGLEKVAEQKGFMQAASEDRVVWTKALFPDYKVTPVESEKVSTSLAGVIGTMVVFGVGFAVIKVITRQPARRGEGKTG
jgi:cobalt/nickel transport system permease protein